MQSKMKRGLDFSGLPIHIHIIVKNSYALNIRENFVLGNRLFI